MALNGEQIYKGWSIIEFPWVKNNTSFSQYKHFVAVKGTKTLSNNVSVSESLRAIDTPLIMERVTADALHELKYYIDIENGDYKGVPKEPLPIQGTLVARIEALQQAIKG